MGWLIVLAAAALALGALWRFGRLDRNALQFAGAALLIAVAGYGWQGMPGLVGTTAKGAEQENPPEVPEELRKTFASSMSSEGEWLGLSDALLRAGKTRAAVSVLSGASKRAPLNPDVWVGLGNALFIHGGGTITPAARFAFDKARTLSPDHPGPAFFIGLGLIQEGKIAEAEELWQGLLNRSPKDAPFREDMQKRLDILKSLSAGPQNPGAQTSAEAPPPLPDAGSSPQTR